jgi:2-iminobutanoate/2-iminopropanoate deaminase
MAMLKEIRTDRAPAAIGPYAQAVACGDLLFVSGQLGLVPASGEPAGATTAEQAEQALKNLREVLLAAGVDMQQVVKTTVYLLDMADFPAFNAVYAAHFSEHRPARACVAVAGLPKNARIEIEAVACLSPA